MRAKYTHLSAEERKALKREYAKNHYYKNKRLAATCNNMLAIAFLTSKNWRIGI